MGDPVPRSLQHERNRWPQKSMRTEGACCPSPSIAFFMQHFVRTVAAALAVDEESVRDGVGHLLEAVRGTVRADDWRLLVRAIPQVTEVLDFARRRARSTCIIGPPPQTPAGLEAELRGLGFGDCRVDLLANCTVRFLKERLGEEWWQRALMRLPALAGGESTRRRVPLASAAPLGVEASVAAPQGGAAG